MKQNTTTEPRGIRARRRENGERNIGETCPHLQQKTREIGKNVEQKENCFEPITKPNGWINGWTAHRIMRWMRREARPYHMNNLNP